MNLIFEKIRIFFSNNIYSIQIRKESKTTSRFSPSNNRIDLENSFSESEIQRKRNCQTNRTNLPITMPASTKIFVGGIRFILGQAQAEHVEGKVEQIGRNEHRANNMASATRNPNRCCGPVSMQYAKVLLSPTSSFLLYRQPKIHCPSRSLTPSLYSSFWSSITSESLGLGI